MESMKQLPRGIQSLDKILKDDAFVYIDKTMFIKDLIDKGSPHYFISRPRRFGKSLFLSTLEEVFNANKELFKSCAIYKTDYRWEKHPVMHFDFSLIDNSSLESFKAGIQDVLEDLAKRYQLEITATSLQSYLVRLVKALAEKYNRVVILVDEYDKPIINHLKNLEIAQSNRDLLRDFFGTLKGLDAYIKFTFITGVSKFSQVSLFSGPNYLTDITMDPAYAAMMGYTEDEVKSSFAPYIQKIAQSRNISTCSILDELKTWYNGYNFSRNSISIYNPYSTLNYMDAGVLESYWYRSGTPSFLIDLVKEHPQSVTSLSGAKALKSTLMDIGDFKRVNLIALMYQTGYLTLTAYDDETDIYSLDFPNREVREAFFNSLIEDFAQIDPTLVITQARNLQQSLINHNIDSFVKMINIYFSKVPYELFSNARESFYHALFLTFLERSGIRAIAEISTNIGRIDLVAELNDAIFIFELKYDKTADVAFDQAEMNRYKERYTFEGKAIIVVGINFSTKSRNINEWKAKLYSPIGQLLSLSSKKPVAG